MLDLFLKKCKYDLYNRVTFDDTILDIVNNYKKLIKIVELQKELLEEVTVETEQYLKKQINKLLQIDHPKKVRG